MKASLWSAAAELTDDAYPQRESCCLGIDLPWELTMTPDPRRGPVDWCPRCAAPWFRIEE